MKTAYGWGIQLLKNDLYNIWVFYNPSMMSLYGAKDLKSQLEDAPATYILWRGFGLGTNGFCLDNVDSKQIYFIKLFDN